MSKGILFRSFDWGSFLLSGFFQEFGKAAFESRGLVLMNHAFLGSAIQDFGRFLQILGSGFFSGLQDRLFDLATHPKIERRSSAIFP